jgi:hypothetical protein
MASPSNHRELLRGSVLHGRRQPLRSKPCPWFLSQGSHHLARHSCFNKGAVWDWCFGHSQELGQRREHLYKAWHVIYIYFSFFQC